MVAESNHQRRVEPRPDEELRVVGREHRQRVSTADALQGGADGAEEVPLVVGFDQVRNDLGVGVGGELMARCLQLGLQLGEVFDDAVVDDEDPVVTVGVRVGVDVSRLPVGRPARVADPQLASRHVGLELLDQHVHLGLGLGDARVVGLAGGRHLQHGDASRVVAAVLEALQALHQDRSRLLVAEVADDSAHIYRTPTRGLFRRIPWCNGPGRVQVTEGA